jgi:hypothetical protein
MNDYNELARLGELLVISESANDAFDHLIDRMASLIDAVGQYRIMDMFDPFALLKLAGEFECCILTSGHDPRVIRMCQGLLTVANISDNELRIGSDGKASKRQVYFVRRQDGLIKIGSSMRPAERVKQLRTGAGEDLELLGHMDGTTAAERQLHTRFAGERKHGEWFEPCDELMGLISSIRKNQGRMTTH